MACILKTVFKNALLKTVFSGGRLGAGVVVGCQISIQPYTNVKQPICSKLKVKKYWYHLLYADVISLFSTRKFKK